MTRENESTTMTGKNKNPAMTKKMSYSGLTRISASNYNQPMKTMYVYIITNKPQGTLYIGVTNNLVRRIYEHKNKIIDGFSAKYSLDKLVYYEIYNDEITAIQREKNLKKWNREWKVNLIESSNPLWLDLYDNITK